MKSLVFALLLSIACCSSIEVTLTGQPVVSTDSCDTSQGYYFFWLPATRTGFEVDTKFQLQLSQPSVYAECTICADSKTESYCSYVTCYINVKTSPLKKATVELPATLDTSALDFDINGWDVYVAPKTVLATNVDCSVPTVTVKGKPEVKDSSCDETKNLYSFWIPAISTNVSEDVNFQIPLTQPNEVKANCNVCDSSKTTEECKYITCTVDVKTSALKKSTVELPETLDTTSYGFETQGWDTFVKSNRVVATDVDCPTGFSGYIKVGAILLVALFLF